METFNYPKCDGRGLRIELLRNFNQHITQHQLTQILKKIIISNNEINDIGFICNYLFTKEMYMIITNDLY